MTIKLFNTLTKQKEEFLPLDSNNVRLYLCGPTVYDRAHIGNARPMVIFDVLYRLLCSTYGIEHVTYVRNITDVDDKINARAKERSLSIEKLTTETIQMFHQDMAAIYCKPLHENENGSKRYEPLATKHIPQMIAMCEKLIASNHAYVAEGHVLFDVSSFQQYGHLSHRSQDEMIAGARVEIAPYKRNPADFVLWKPSKEDEPGWDSPYGYGRPGWHIECSAMATQYLGETFDIHGGGIDLQFPHHENEIAQSCCANPQSQFAKFWVHNGFLTVNGEKMSKSLGNFFTVRDLLNQGVKGEVIRYILLSTHYRKPLDWNQKSLDDAKKSVTSFYNAISNFNNIEVNYDIIKNGNFIENLKDDLNTPKAIAYLHELVSRIHKTNDSSKKLELEIELLTIGEMLGLLHKVKNIIPENLQSKIDEYTLARAQKDWAKSDTLRKELEKYLTIRDQKGLPSTFTLKDSFNPQ